MKTLLYGWNFMRIFRILISALFVWQGITTGDRFVVFVGALFGLMALFNLGCCAAGSCTIRNSVSQPAKTKEVEYEELSEKK